MSLTTGDTNLSVTNIIPFRAVSDTGSVKGEGEAWAIGALRSNEENILIRKILDEGLTNIKLKYKFSTGPNSLKTEGFLRLVINDEACYAVNSGIISTNIIFWNMAYLATHHFL